MPGRTRIASTSAALLTAAALTACHATAPPVTPTTSPVSLAPNVFNLTPGIEHDACGIGLIVKFIPATAQSSTADFAVVIAGAVGHVDDPVQDHTGDQPLPSNAVHPRQGVVVTLLGKRFGVNSIDASSSTVQLTALC